MEEPSIRFKFNSAEFKSLLRSVALTAGGLVAIQLLEAVTQLDLGPVGNQLIILLTPTLINAIRLFVKGKTNDAA